MNPQGFQVMLRDTQGSWPCCRLGNGPWGVTRRGEDAEPVTHVSAEQVVDGCEEAGLQDQGHHCDQ